MRILIDVVKFGFAVFILFYLPGRFLIGVIKKEVSFWERTIVSFCVGLFIIPHIYFYSEEVKLQNFFLMVAIVSSVIYFGYTVSISFLNKAEGGKIKFNLALSWTSIFLGGIVLVVLVIALLTISTSGIVYNDGLRFYQGNAFDSAVQIALTGGLLTSFPHEFLFYSGLHLKGYYCGAFYWRALVQKITNIDPVDLFFRFSPPFLFPLVVTMAFFSIKNLTGNKNTALIATFFIFLMSDLSWIFPVIDRLLPSHDIMTIELYGKFLRNFMFNPALAHGVLIFFIGCYFLKESCIIKERRRLWPALLFAGFLFGSLYEYKSFMWAAVLPSLILVGVKEYFFDKKNVFLKISMVAIIFSISPFLKLSSHNKTISLFKLSVGYYPLSIFKEMGLIDSQAQISFFIILAAFLFYLIGTLSIKIVGFIKIYQYLKRWRGISSITLFLIFSMLFSFIFTHTLLFRHIYFYATYNFFAVFLLIISIFGAEAITNWTKNLGFFSKTMIFSVIFVLGMGSTVFSFLGFFPKYSKYKVVSHGVLEASEYIKENSERDAVLLHALAPRDWIAQKEYKKIMDGEQGRDCFISALTQRRVVLESEWNIIAYGCASNLEERQRDVRLFFDTDDEAVAVKILNKYNVSYILLEKAQRLHFEKELILEKVFSNSQVEIYKRIHM